MPSLPSGKVTGTMYASGANVELKGLRSISCNRIEAAHLRPAGWEIALEFDPFQCAMPPYPSALTFVSEIDGQTEVAIFDVQGDVIDTTVARKGEVVRQITVFAPERADPDDAQAYR